MDCSYNILWCHAPFSIVGKLTPLITAFNYTEMQANFNRYRNDLKKAITHAKRSHYKTLFERFKFDMKKTWSIISENLNKNVRNPIPDKMTINGVDCCDKQVIADNFNSFFASIGEQNARNITEEHGNSSYRDYLTDRIDSQFIFRTIDNNYTIQDTRYKIQDSLFQARRP